jgi:ribosomal protein L21E
MKKGQTVTVTAPFHAYRGHTGTITNTATDDDGDIIFVRLGNGQEVMLEPTDVKGA